MPCLSTPFLWCLPKETVSSRQRKALFYCGGSTIRVSAPASVVGGHLRPTWGGGGWLSERSSQLDAVGCDVGASSPWERRAGPNSPRGGTQKRVSLGLHPVSLRKSKEMGWNRQYRPQTTSQEIGAHVPALLPKVGRGTSRPPTCSAHANGGATKVKKALFFGGSTPFLWASTKEMGSNGSRGQRQPPNVTAHTHKAQ